MRTINGVQINETWGDTNSNQDKLQVSDLRAISPENDGTWALPFEVSGIDQGVIALFASEIDAVHFFNCIFVEKVRLKKKYLTSTAGWKNRTVMITHIAVHRGQTGLTLRRAVREHRKTTL